MKIMHIKRTIRTWSDKFKDLFFKSTNRFRISNIIIELIPLNNSGWKKRFSKVFMLNIKYRDVVMVSGSPCW